MFAEWGYARRMRVEAKITGQRRRVAEPLDIASPAPPVTLAGLIEAVVRAEVDAFHLRQVDNQLLRVLTPDEIAAGLTAGRISSGGSELDQTVDVEEAIATAIQAFSDGLYFVFVDGEQVESLEDPVAVTDDSSMMFVRLVPLAGG